MPAPAQTKTDPLSTLLNMLPARHKTVTATILGVLLSLDLARDNPWISLQAAEMIWPIIAGYGALGVRHALNKNQVASEATADAIRAQGPPDANWATAMKDGAPVKIKGQPESQFRGTDE